MKGQPKTWVTHFRVVILKTKRKNWKPRKNLFMKKFNQMKKFYVHEIAAANL